MQNISSLEPMSGAIIKNYIIPEFYSQITISSGHLACFSKEVQKLHGVLLQYLHTVRPPNHIMLSVMFAPLLFPYITLITGVPLRELPYTGLPIPQ